MIRNGRTKSTTAYCSGSRGADSLINVNGLWPIYNREQSAVQNSYCRRLRSASSLSLNVRRTRLSTVGDRAIGPFLLLLSVNSLPHPLYLFSEVASRLSSTGVPSYDFYRNFCSACAVTVVIFRHFNRFFFYFLLRKFEKI